ncbi:MAG: DUF2007 domain-containing protein [Nannocystaceae bacterium]
MVDGSAWVLLAECNDVAELHTLRAALEARGVPCRIEGEHTHGIMGPIHGAMVRSRVLVPAPALPVARALAAEVVGPFEDPALDGEPDDDEEDDDAEPSPFRRPGEPLSPVDDDEPPAPRRKSATRLILVALLVVGPLFGLAHLYADRPVRAGVLALLSLFSLPAAIGGAPWAQVLLVAVWIADLVGGALGVAAYNRALPRSSDAGEAPQNRQ